MKRFFEAAAFYALLLPLAFLPCGVSTRLGRMFGAAAFALMRKNRRRTMGNIERARAWGFRLEDERPAREIARETFMNLGQLLAEIAILSFGFPSRMVRDVSVEGLEHFERARAEGRPVVAITAHLGSWEFMSSVMPQRLGPSWTLAKQQKNPYLNAALDRARTRFGFGVIYKKGALKVAMRALRAGEPVGVVMDEVLWPDQGVPVTYLGAPLHITGTPAALARRTGALVLPVVVDSTGPCHVVRVYPPIPTTGDVDADTQAMADFFSAYIARHPGQWLQWLRRWKWADQAEERMAKGGHA